MFDLKGIKDVSETEIKSITNKILSFVKSNPDRLETVKRQSTERYRSLGVLTEKNEVDKWYKENGINLSEYSVFPISFINWSQQEIEFFHSVFGETAFEKTIIILIHGGSMFLPHIDHPSRPRVLNFPLHNFETSRVCFYSPKEGCNTRNFFKLNEIEEVASYAYVKNGLFELNSSLIHSVVCTNSDIRIMLSQSLG